MKFWYRLCFLISLITLPLHAKEVLLINSYHVGHGGSDLRVRGFKSALPEDIQIHEVYMDTKRKPASQFESIAQQTWGTFQKIKPDLVIVNDDNALRMLGEKISNTGTPVVFMGINNNPRSYFTMTIPKNVSGVLERHLIVPLVRYFKSFVPMKKKRVLILFDESKTSTSVIATALYGKHTLSFGKVTIIVKKYSLAKDYIQAATDAALEYDFVVLDTFYTLKDINGKPVKYQDVLLAINHASKIPVFGVTDYSVGKDATAGALTMSMEKHGAVAATYTQKILEGKKLPNNYRNSKSDIFVFNQTMLDKYQLTLPEPIRKQAIFR